MCKMIDKKEFRDIGKRLKEYDLNRERLIKKSRDVLKVSKQLIYSLHRKNIKEADTLLKQARKEKAELDSIAKKHAKLSYEGSYSEACQEYVEALCYYDFIKNSKVTKLSSLKVSMGDYLMGISDLTGEVTRRAVTIANKDIDSFKKIKKLVEEIFGEFLKFDLRNGNLRKKSDSIKWNLKKLEDIAYDIEKNKKIS